MNKKFPRIVHMAYEPDQDGRDDYLATYSDGVATIDAGRRCAIYKLVDEGIVRGPKSFVSSSKRRP